MERRLITAINMYFIALNKRRKTLTHWPLCYNPVQIFKVLVVAAEVPTLNIILKLWWYFNSFKKKTSKPTNLCILLRIFNLQILYNPWTTSEVAAELKTTNVSSVRSRGAIKEYSSLLTTSEHPNLKNPKTSIIICKSLYPTALTFKRISIASVTMQQVCAGLSQKTEGIKYRRRKENSLICWTNFKIQ